MPLALLRRAGWRNHGRVLPAHSSGAPLRCRRTQLRRPSTRQRRHGRHRRCCSHGSTRWCEPSPWHRDVVHVVAVHVIAPVHDDYLSSTVDARLMAQCTGLPRTAPTCPSPGRATRGKCAPVGGSRAHSLQAVRTRRNSVRCCSSSFLRAVRSCQQAEVRPRRGSEGAPPPAGASARWSMRSWRTRSVRTPAPQHCTRCAGEDPQVILGAAVIDVVQVKPYRLLPVQVRPSRDLP